MTCCSDPAAAGAARGGSIRRGLAEGAALTIAATLATAPLMAHHFEAFSLAVAAGEPAGAAGGRAGDVAGDAVGDAGPGRTRGGGPLNAVCGLLIGYIAWVAHVFGTAGWSQARIRLSAGGRGGAPTRVLLAAGSIAALAARRRAALGVQLRRRPRPLLAALAAVR